MDDHSSLPVSAIIVSGNTALICVEMTCNQYRLPSVTAGHRIVPIRRSGVYVHGRAVAAGSHHAVAGGSPELGAVPVPILALFLSVPDLESSRLGKF
jgi:hypothetical protein